MQGSVLRSLEKVGCGRLTDLVAEAGSDTWEPGVLGDVAVLSQPQFLHP